MKKRGIRIVSLIVVIVIIIGGIYVYSGGMSNPSLTYEEQKYVLAYREHIGPYADVFAAIQQVQKALDEEGIPTQQTMGVYYDDPEKVSAEKLRSHVGVSVPLDFVGQLDHTGENYQILPLPKTKRLVARFPYKSMFSILIGVQKAYPTINEYLTENNYKTEVPRIEIYDADTKEILYITPLHGGPAPQEIEQESATE